MTRDDVIRMAREAGFDESNAACAVIVRHSNGSWVGIEERLAMFAELVAKHGREACAKVCEQHAKDSWDHEGGALVCADKIRARGES